MRAPYPGHEGRGQEAFGEAIRISNVHDRCRYTRMASNAATATIALVLRRCGLVRRIDYFRTKERKVRRCLRRHNLPFIGYHCHTRGQGCLGRMLVTRMGMRTIRTSQHQQDSCEQGDEKDAGYEPNTHRSSRMSHACGRFAHLWKSRKGCRFRQRWPGCRVRATFRFGGSACSFAPAPPLAAVKRRPSRRGA